MVTLPKGFTATRYPGYFWHCQEKKLYSIKIGGELRELPRRNPNHWNNWRSPGYNVSHRGRRRTLLLIELQKLKPKNSVINVKRKKQTTPAG